MKFLTFISSKFFAALVVGASLCLNSYGVETNTPVRSVSLKECIDLVLKHNLGIQAARFGPQIFTYELRSSYGIYDPALNIRASRHYVDQPSAFDPKKLNDIKTPTGTTNIAGLDWNYTEYIDSVGPSVDGKLPFGLGYSLFARTDHFDSITYPFPYQIPGLLLNKAAINDAITNNYASTAGITLTQPLLRDFLIDSYRRDIQLNKKNLKISELALKQQLISNVTAVISAYYNLIFAKEQIAAQKQELELAVELLRFVHQKVELHAVSPLEQPRAELQVESVKTVLFAAQQSYIEQQNTLKNLISDDFQAIADVQLEPGEALVLNPEPTDRNEAWKTALLERPDLQQMKLDLEKQDIIVKFNSNQRLPRFDIIGSYGWQSVQNSFDDSVDSVRNRDHKFYSIGALLSIPIGNVAARNTYKASQVSKQQAVTLFKKLQQDVLAQVDTAVKVEEVTLQQAGSARKAREYAKLALEAEQKKFENGSSTSFVVLEYQNKLTEARTAEFRALAQYNIAKAQLASSEGTTLERNQIQVNVR
ncbi:MAG: bepC [Verrucomicrobiales bacterium]|nr:bepC [Verrucomicrobiales bacterium]